MTSSESPIPIQERAFVIYLSGPSPEGKYYIGQSTDFNRRCLTHQAAKGGCPQFHQAIQRYGWHALRPVIVAQTDILEDADRLERLYITKYNALFPHGYNLTLGGRYTLFDPEASITSFQEAPVPQEEIIAEAKSRLTYPHGCRVCGAGGPDEPGIHIEFSSSASWEYRNCAQCGVGFEFGSCVLSHLLTGESAADFSLPNSLSMKESLYRSIDADFMCSIEQSRLGVRRVDETLPVVAVRYTERIIPYIQQSLKRYVLMRKGLPSFSLGKFRPFTGKRSEALIVMKVEHYLRKHRKSLAISFDANVEVFSQALAYYGTTSAREKIVTEILTERGATSEELKQAVQRNCIRRTEPDRHV